MSINNPLDKIVVSRRQAVALGLGGFATMGLAACGGSSDNGSSASGTSSEKTSGKLDKDAYDKLIKESSKQADDATISANKWASKVKEAGKLRVGGVQTSELFSYLDDKDNKVRGFDAGLSQLLAAYILGDSSKIDLTQVTSDTRESVLQNDQVDAVFATYSINDDRKKLIDFAGPYFTARQGIMVLATNKDINSVDDLAGKKVAVQSGSTGPSIVKEEAPKAIQKQYKTDEEARAALEQHRVDAYIIDQTMQMGSMISNPGKYRLLKQLIGPKDSYGIGLPKDSDAAAFVNAWLQKVEDDGVWEKLWKVCMGTRIGQKTAPKPPAIED